jgi:hypothetical protein
MNPDIPEIEKAHLQRFAMRLSLAWEGEESRLFAQFQFFHSSAPPKAKNALR